MSFPRYPAHSPVNLEWVREIPSQWTLKRLKNVTRINMGQSPSSEDCNLEAVGCPFLQGNAEFGDRSPTPRMYCSSPKKLASAGDILLSVRAPVGAINVADQDYGIGRGLCAIRPVPGVVREFLVYVLFGCREALISVSNGSTYEAVSAEQVGNLGIPVPPPSEQKSIAAFLNSETAKIDALIVEQERLIELLKEKRQAVISQAVTKGLNPDARTKPSGIEWVGDIPSHWNVGGLTRFIEPIVDYRGRTPTKQDQGIFLVTARNIRQGRIDYSISQEYVDPESAASLLNRGKPAIGDLLFTTEAPLGQVALVDRTDIAIAQRIVKFRGMPDVMDNRFLMYWIMSDQCQARLTTLATGSTALGIKASKLGMIGCPVPPFFEQAEIVTHCGNEVERCEKLILESESTIALLVERRSALISAAVTGQIDVRVLAEQKAA